MSVDIDWDDPEAVAAARGDVEPDADPKDPDEDPKSKDKDPDPDPEPEPEPKDKYPDEDPKSKDSDPKGQDSDDPMLPKSRYDSVKARLDEQMEANKELAQRLEAAQAPKQQGESAEDRLKVLEDATEALDTQIAEALADGDKELGAALRSEQRRLEREAFRLEMKQESLQSSDTAVEQVRLDLTIDQVEEMYPQLDPNSEDYDKALLQEVQETRGAFMALGSYTPTQALLKAVKLHAPIAPAAAEADPEPTSKKDEVEQQRRKKALKTSTKAAAAQPPSLDGVGDDADAAGIVDNIDTSKLTLADLDKMPIEQLQKLRGDFG
jgi:hypothetical protein